MCKINQIFIITLALFLVIGLAGCQSGDGGTQSQIDELRFQLDDANARIEALEQEKDEQQDAPSASSAEEEQSRDDTPEGSAPESTAPEIFSGNDSAASGTKVIDLGSGGQNSLTSSSSFTAAVGQTLTLEVKADIQGGAVDFFLFSPSNQEQKFTFSSDDTKTIELSAGTWAYNCTGFFESGEITITGTLE